MIFRSIGAASAALILAACTSPAPTAPTTTQEPLEFHFKWNEGEPGYEWMVNCLGGDPQPGESLEPGAIVIVDVDAAMRASGLIPGVEPTLADFEKGLRCARDD